MDAFEDRLRTALRGRADEVRPNPATWSVVQERIRRRRWMTWGAPATALAAVLAFVLLVVPGLLPTGDDGIELIPADSGTDEAPEDQDPPADEDSPAPDGTESSDDIEGPAGDDQPDLSEETDDAADDGPAVTVYYVRSAPTRLYVEPVEVSLGAPTVGVARAAMEFLVAGVPENALPSAEDLVTLAPEGTRVLGATIRDGVLRLDVSAEVRSGQVGAEGEQMFAEQLAHTATQFDGVEAVRLIVQGQEISELWGHLDWSEPISPDEFALSPVTIESVTSVDGGLQVGGQATVYEGTVELTLRDQAGRLVDEAVVTATCGGPCRGNWEHTFDVAPGSYTVTASQPTVSTEGPGPFEISADVTRE